MKDARTWIIIGLAVVVILLLVFRGNNGGPSKEQIEREAQYARQAAIDNVEKTNAVARADSIQKSHVEYKDSVKVALSAKDKRIHTLTTRLTQQRPTVQPYLDTIPVLKQFVQTQDSLLQTQDSTIQILRASNYRIAKDFDALSIAMVDERKISEKMLQDCEANRESLKNDLEKATKKEVRKVKFWKAAAVVGTVGAFLLGAQL